MEKNQTLLFSELGLAPQILEAVHKKGYTEPSSIQAKAIPQILAGADVVASAQTGSGKTAAFTLPILTMLSQSLNKQNHPIQALILTPTRELAHQIEQNVIEYGKGLSLHSLAVFGGAGIVPQIQKLRLGVDILIATPGRLMDLYRQGELDFSYLKILVLDEADRMLDMGFIKALQEILKLLPPKRQNLFFSATFSPELRQLAYTFLRNPVEVSVHALNTAVETIEQMVYQVEHEHKARLLIKILEEKEGIQALVFCRTKMRADKLCMALKKKKIQALAIHSNKSQSARMHALKQFKVGSNQILVATDIASRGLDIKLLPLVINYDLPQVPEDYVHRIGRTGRAGESGNAITFVCPNETKMIRDIEKLIKQRFLMTKVHENDLPPITERTDELSKTSHTGDNQYIEQEIEVDNVSDTSPRQYTSQSPRKFLSRPRGTRYTPSQEAFSGENSAPNSRRFSEKPQYDRAPGSFNSQNKKKYGAGKNPNFRSDSNSTPRSDSYSKPYNSDSSQKSGFSNFKDSMRKRFHTARKKITGRD